MSKVVTDLEVAEMVKAAIQDPNWNPEAYKAFLETVANALTEHFGGYVSSVSGPIGATEQDPHLSTENGDRYCVHFLADERVPADGGIYARYDTDVPVKEWLEHS